MTTDSLSLWAIYDHPADFPDCFVARRWDVKAGYSIATPIVRTAPTLRELREGFERIGLVKMQRYPGDDPVIVEVWL